MNEYPTYWEGYHKKLYSTDCKQCPGCVHYAYWAHEPYSCDITHTIPLELVCDKWERRRDECHLTSHYAIIYGLIAGGEIEKAKRMLEKEFIGVPCDMITYNVDRSEYWQKYKEAI
jgi:hypothetical protein